jgi:hypothetical protein
MITKNNGAKKFRQLRAVPAVNYVENKLRTVYRKAKELLKREALVVHRGLLKEREKLLKRSKYYRGEFLALASNTVIYRHGSMTPGIKEWEDKWENSAGKRILFYATKDYSGSFYKWACAVNKYTPFAVRLVTSSAHRYGYSQDLMVHKSIQERDRELIFGEFPKAHDNLLELAKQADLIHFKDESSWTTSDANHLLWRLYNHAKTSGLPVIFTHYGGNARKQKGIQSYQEFVQTFDARIALTPDLNYEWFDGYFIPQSIDVHSFAYTWQDIPVITHSPSSQMKKSPYRKNTELFEQAVKNTIPDTAWSYTRIQDVSYEECLKLKQPSGLFFDQAGKEDPIRLGVDDIIGAYGNSAIEAMVFGIPTIAHISEQAFAGAERAGKPIRDLCPILNVAPELKSMEAALRDYMKMTPKERKALSLKTRQWIEDFHSYETNGRELAQVYEKLLGSRRA